ncbi:hypothetical protein GIB67_012330 [Kingdonia uniflora]|uniref:Pectinesterase inhibitor domain-containing protein n=1 Tax=Kingdonia uniflora TaxID=39325 RepID=A0A7J7MVJ5_9MAGN|nr:hypothetical protein GIB67_012330 [Kingdonia uniflora]
MTSLQSIPESCTSNLQELGIISLELAIANAKSTVRGINKLIRDKDSDPYAVTCLRDCLELYSNAIPTLEDSISAFRCNDFGSVNIWMSAGMEASRTCEGGFEEKEGEISPLTKENNGFYQLCDIALVISTLFTLPSPISLFSEA